MFVSSMQPERHHQARLAQSVERQALNLVVGGSSPPVGDSFFLYDSQTVFRMRRSASMATTNTECILVEEKIHHILHIQPLQVGVFLTRSHKHNRFPSAVYHGERRANLVINRIKLGQDDAVHQSGLRQIREIVKRLPFIPNRIPTRLNSFN